MTLTRHQTALNWLIKLPVGVPQQLSSDQKLIIIDIWDSDAGIPFKPDENHSWYINVSENFRTVTKHQLV